MSFHGIRRFHAEAKWFEPETIGQSAQERANLTGWVPMVAVVLEGSSGPTTHYAVTGPAAPAFSVVLNKILAEPGGSLDGSSVLHALGMRDQVWAHDDGILYCPRVPSLSDQVAKFAHECGFPPTQVFTNNQIEISGTDPVDALVRKILIADPVDRRLDSLRWDAKSRVPGRYKVRCTIIDPDPDLLSKAVDELVQSGRAIVSERNDYSCITLTSKGRQDRAMILGSPSAPPDAALV